MDPVIALYTILLATALGLSGLARSDTRRRGRGLLLAGVLSGFIVVAATSALVTATTIPGMIVTALAVLFSAQAATAALSLLWREIRAESRPRSSHPSSEAGRK